MQPSTYDNIVNQVLEEYFGESNIIDVDELSENKSPNNWY
jgi:hypothetical protein